ncbi:MAG: Fe-S cluster assembly protein SufD [Pseudomonadota bacterium]
MSAALKLPDNFLVDGAELGALPAPLAKWRQRAAGQAAELSLPTRRTENWKYTSRHLKLDEALGQRAAGSSAPEQRSEGYQLVIRNGRIDREASQLPAVDGLELLAFSELDELQAKALADKLGSCLDPATTQLAPLNGARLEDGLLLRLAKNTVLEQPLYISVHSDSEHGGSVYPRLFVEAGEHSQMTAVEEYTSVGDHPLLVHTINELDLAPGARITWVRVSLEPENTRHIGATGARLAANARLEHHSIGFGGELRRHDLQVRLEESGAECKLNGVAVTQGRQHYDNHTVIEHVAPHCNSEETYRNIAADKSHVIFNGRIHIHPDAQKSLAEMNNKNLLLSSSAEIDTKPELEIYADDVQCAHGATVGRLDERSLFYLVSRGIDRREAQTLLSMAFINELVAQVPVDGVRDIVDQRLSQFIQHAFRGES